MTGPEDREGADGQDDQMGEGIKVLAPSIRVLSRKQSKNSSEGLKEEMLIVKICLLTYLSDILCC